MCIYESCIHGQTDDPIFCYFETNLDRLLGPEIYVIPIFLKIVRSFLDNVNVYIIFVQFQLV